MDDFAVLLYIFTLFLLGRVSWDPNDTSVGQKSKVCTRNKASIPNLFWRIKAKSRYTVSVKGKQLRGWLTITWILEAVSDSWWRWWWWRRCCRARPVRGKRRSWSTSLVVQPCPGGQLGSSGQSPWSASIPAYGRRWRERTWSKTRRKHTNTVCTRGYSAGGKPLPVSHSLLLTNWRGWAGLGPSALRGNCPQHPLSCSPGLSRELVLIWRVEIGGAEIHLRAHIPTSLSYRGLCRVLVPEAIFKPL